MLSPAGAEVERVFRENLKKNARDGRSLLGVQESLKAQGKQDAARLVQQEFEAAWQQADTTFSRAELLGKPAVSLRTTRAAAPKAARR